MYLEKFCQGHEKATKVKAGTTATLIRFGSDDRQTLIGAPATIMMRK